MAIRAFGDLFNQVDDLPFGSGISVPASGAYGPFSTCRAIYLGQGGDLEIKLNDQQDKFLTFSGLARGQIVRLGATEIGPQSTASKIILLY